MTTPLSPPDDSEANGAVAPPPGYDTRPRAGIAVWALALAIVLMVVSAFTGFLWILLLPAAILGVIAMVRIDPAVRKGRGMAIAALVIAALAGSCQYVVARQFLSGAAEVAEGVLAAASGEDEKKIDAWLTEDAVAKGEGANIRARLAAVVERMGPWRREAETGSALLGMWSLSAVPDGVEHVGGAGEEDHTIRPGAGWVTAHFEKGPVHVELLVNMQALQTVDKEAYEKGHALPILDEVRFYVPKAEG